MVDKWTNGNVERPWEVKRDQRWNFFFHTKFRSDAVLVIGLQNQEVKVHRSVLEMSSEIFYEEFQKVNNNRLIIRDEDPQLFIMFLKHLYLGDSGASVEDCLPLLQLARKYEVKDLMEFCEHKLSVNFTVENVTTLFQQAMKIGHQDLTNKSLDFLCRKAYWILKSENFLELRQECLYEILKRDDLRVGSEMQLFNAVLRWGEAECSRQKMDFNNTDNLRKVLGTVLGLIRFPLMDKKEFTLNVAMRNLLDETELFFILLFFNVSAEKGVLIPQGRVNGSPRNYINFCNDLLTVSRCPPEDKKSQLKCNGCGNSEFLEFKTDKSIVLLGFKMFDWLRCFPQNYDKDSDIHNFYNCELTLSIKDISSGDFLLDQKKNAFNSFQPINLKKGIEVEANLWYSITATLSGQARVWNKIHLRYHNRNLPIFTGLQSSCYVECEEGEEKMEKINFQFRRQHCDAMSIEEGVIEEFVFKLRENIKFLE